MVWILYVLRMRILWLLSFEFLRQKFILFVLQRFLNSRFLKTVVYKYVWPFINMAIWYRYIQEFLLLGATKQRILLSIPMVRYCLYLLYICTVQTHSLRTSSRVLGSSSRIVLKERMTTTCKCILHSKKEF